MLRIFCKWSLLLCTALCAHAGWAQVLELTGDEGRPTRPPLAYFVDESAELSLPAVLAIPATEFVDSGTGGLALGFTRSVVWLKIDIINRSREIDNWLMQINDPLLDDIRVYQQDATGQWTEKRLGDQGVTAEDAVEYGIVDSVMSPAAAPAGLTPSAPAG